MIKNEISATLDQITLNKILANLNEAYALIPTMVSLTVQQRKESIKMGDASIPFVQKAYEEVSSNPALLPNFVNLPEMKKDMDYDAGLMKIEILLAKIADGVSDTRLVVGSEALNAALSIYAYIKQAVNQNVPGAKSARVNLKARFMYKKHDTETTPTT